MTKLVTDNVSSAGKKVSGILPNIAIHIVTRTFSNGNIRCQQRNLI